MPSRTLRQQFWPPTTLVLISLLSFARAQRFTASINPSASSPGSLITTGVAPPLPTGTAAEVVWTATDLPITPSSSSSTITSSPTPSPSSTPPSSPSLSAPAAAGIGIALTLLLVLLLLLLALHIHRRRRRQRKLNITLSLSRRRSDSDVDWNNMLKPVASPTGSSINKKKKKPLPQQPHRLETNLPRGKQMLTPLSATTSGTTTFAPTPLSEVVSANPFEAEVFEMPGSAVSGGSEEVVVMELEGCTPVEREGRFVWPGEKGGRGEVETSRSGSGRSMREERGSGRSGSRWSLLRRDKDAEPPAVPVKDAGSKSVALKR